MKSNKFKDVDIKNRICYYFDHIINSNDFDLDNILLVEKSHETMSIYNVARKLHTVQGLYTFSSGK